MQIGRRLQRSRPPSGALTQQPGCHRRTATPAFDTHRNPPGSMRRPSVLPACPSRPQVRRMAHLAWAHSPKPASRRSGICPARQWVPPSAGSRISNVVTGIVRPQPNWNDALPNPPCCVPAQRATRCCTQILSQGESRTGITPGRRIVADALVHHDAVGIPYVHQGHSFGPCSDVMVFG